MKKPEEILDTPEKCCAFRDRHEKAAKEIQEKYAFIRRKTAEVASTLIFG